MFDSVAFNVVIGMVFIYLLYSLLTTILTELVSTWLDFRTKTMQKAIQRMLTDGVETEEDNWRGTLWLRKVWQWIRLWFNGVQGKFVRTVPKRADFAEIFYNTPSIKYLSKGQRGFWSLPGSSKAPYFSKEYFAQTLLHLFREKGAGASDFEKVQFCLDHNTLGIDPQTLKHLQNLLLDARGEYDAFSIQLQRWFEETMDRVNGWFKSKQRWVSFLLGLAIAITLNVDSIRIARMLSKDPSARNHLVEMGMAFAIDSSKAGYIVQHGSDSIKSKAVIDSSYNLIQNDLQDAKSTLGLGWTFPQKERNTSIKPAYHSLVSLVHLIFTEQDSVRFLEASLKSIETQLRWQDIILSNRSSNNREIEQFVRYSEGTRRESLAVRGTLSRSGVDSLKSVALQLHRFGVPYTNSFQTGIRHILLQNAELLSAETTKAVLSYSKEIISDAWGRTHEFLNEHLKILNRALGENYESIVYFYDDRSHGVRIAGLGEPAWYDNLFFIGCSVFSSGTALFGWIITALALSMGAPFWFDLLQKLVSLRGTGVKPEEKEGGSKPANLPMNVGPGGVQNGQPQPPPQPTTPDTTSDEFNDFRADLLKQPGVNGVGLQILPAGVQMDIIASTQVAIDGLKKSYGDGKTFADGKKVLLKYVIGSTVKAHAASVGSGICNNADTMRAGVLCCFLKKVGSKGIFFISCGHVLKNDKNWSLPFAKSPVSTIADGKLGPGIGDVIAGRVGDAFDVGIVECDSSVFGALTSHHIEAMREVGIPDSFNRISVTLCGNNQGFKTAELAHHSIEVDIEYPGPSVIRLSDLFSLTTMDTGKPVAPTRDGDSGTLVIDTQTREALGMVVAGDGHLTYVMKFSNAFSPSGPCTGYTIISEKG